ncbi:MAG: recombinase family protein [Candidatus Peribacteraceae bacterium]|nr:recombinase family protein [Candidatus Peribacteraceae bacterium]
MARRKPPKISAKAPIWCICRKSLEDKNKQIESIPDQKKLGHEYYERTVSPEIRKSHPLHFVVTEQSGFVPGLPTVKAVCDAARKGDVYGVIVARVNRIGRNHEDLGQFTQFLADGFIPFLDTTDGKRYEGKDAGTIIMLCLEGAMGWHESAEKSKVVHDRMRLRASEGKHMGRKMFGFKKHHVTLENGEVLRHTVIDEERFLHVITIFRMAAAGTSFSDIERWAKEEEIDQRNGKPLKKSAIAGIIHNPYYKGATRYDGVVYENTHEVHIPVPLWNAAQVGVSKRARHSGRKKNQELRQLFLFGDTMCCGKCGHVMSPYRVVKKETSRSYIFYECKNRHTKCKELIKQERRDKKDKEDGLREQFDAMMNRFTVSDVMLADVREKLAGLHKEKAAVREAEMRDLQEKYKTLNAALTEQVLALARAEALGVGHIIVAKIDELKIELESTQAKLNTVHDESMDWIEKVIGNFKLIELVREAILYGSPAVKEAMIRAVCSNLKIHDKKLIPEPRSPFKEALNRRDDKEWWAIVDLNH